MDTQNFIAGAAEIDITPPLGTAINGDFVSHYAHVIHDPLYAKALVLQNNEQTIAFVVVDICMMRKDFVDEVKREIFERCAITRENILISATHTHAGGSIEDLLLAVADLTYRKKLSGLIIEAVIKAKENMCPAKIAFGSVEVPEHTVCRRYFMKPEYKAYNPVTDGYDIIKTNPLGYESQIAKREGTTDPEVCYLVVKGMDDQWISLLANYSMHYAGDWENGTITADYFGVFSEQIKSKLQAPDGFVAMMSNGTSGDANIIDFLEPGRYPSAFFAKSNLIGNDIAGRIADSVKGIEWDMNAPLSVQYTELPVSIRKPTPRELSAAKSVVVETRYDHLAMKESSHTGNEDAFRRIYAREQILLNEYPDTILFPVQVFRIGAGIIGGLGGEFFAETGLWLKENNKAKNYFTVCLANGYVGYVPPLHEFELGGYETWRCRSSFLEKDAENIIRNKLRHLAGDI
ncbi:MAG: hypothetical protein EPN37_06330 [Chitinophagaceae bacterium]|nr:MAG: hypothetical protein EPN37_06330 [Chitinophagaceae bacterium]